MPDAVNDNMVNAAAADDVVTCATVAYREIELCVPITVKPFANVKEVVVRCCGEPTIGNADDRCKGVVGGVCDFNIHQRICVEVPVEFGAESHAEEVHVECGTASTEPCRSCKPVYQEPGGEFEAEEKPV